MLELRPRDLALPLGRRLDARHQNSSPPAGGVSARSSAFLCHVWLCPTGPYSAALYPAGLPLIAALPITPHSRTPHRRSHARCWLRPRSPSSPFQRSTRGSCVCTRTYSLLLPLKTREARPSRPTPSPPLVLPNNADLDHFCRPFVRCTNDLTHHDRPGSRLAG